MKLYTEEQVLEAIRISRTSKLNLHVGITAYIETTYGILDKLKPIELPSDEEIENYAYFAFPNAEKIGKETYSAFRGMKAGAKWVIEQIKQQANGK